VAVGWSLAFFAGLVATSRRAVLPTTSDVGYLLLSLVVVVVMLANAWSERGANRRFWALLGSGCLLWVCNQVAWIYFEVVRHTSFPDPSVMDLFLFLHLVPMIAAVALRPHRS